MKTASLEDLVRIRCRVRSWLASQSDASVMDRLAWSEYHGFGKAVLPEPAHTALLHEFGYTPHDVQVEIVRVDRDLSDEIHHHEDATACILVLGPNEGFPTAVSALVYIALMQAWGPAASGDRMTFLPGTLHGFTVRSGGILYFLSVQSPPITGPDGRNDYHK